MKKYKVIIDTRIVLAVFLVILLLGVYNLDKNSNLNLESFSNLLTISAYPIYLLFVFGENEK